MTASGDNVIAVTGLVKRFDSLTAVDDISFTVRRGEVFGILGPNGAGKTTTLECIEGLQKPTAGTLEVLGMDVLREPRRVKERIGVQVQASAYFDYLTLREILQLFGSLYARRVAPDELLAKVDLLAKATTTVGKLSGGQKQRFAVAATLVNEPEVVFLDEPTTGLDPQARRNLWEVVRSIQSEGRTVVLTTHYMEEAQALCQRVAIMDRARIVALDTPENLIRTLSAPYEVKMLTKMETAMDDLGGLDAVVGVQRDDDGSWRLRSSDAARTLPALLEWVNQAGAGLANLEVKPATLEDVFLALTGRGLEPGSEEESA